MKVALFIPCYVDQFYPQVGIATLELLEKLGCDVHFPLQQTCCGQPMANAGYAHLSVGCEQNFIENFKGFDHIVSPSGSCVLHAKDHIHLPATTRVYELTEFLIDVLKVEKLTASFNAKVGLHQSCHGQRGLKISQMSELVAAPFSKSAQLLGMVSGLELVNLDRRDECCGFGGTFCVSEEAISVKMGKDRLADHQKQEVEYITGVDVSCLMHLEGIIRRQNTHIKVKHIAEILNGTLLD